jgi:glycosyltransferase involved in cell wall biosynthesis
VGGVENVLRQHAGLMTAAGHQVRVIAGRGEQTDRQVEFVRLPLVDSRDPQVLAVKAELDQGRVPEAFEDLSRRIERELRPLLTEADWLICHNVCSLNKNLALTLAVHRISESQERPRIILWHHDLAWTTPRYLPELHDGFPWSLLRSDWPDAVQVAVSRQRQAELSALLGVGADRIRVIPNGIDVADFLDLDPASVSLIEDLRLMDKRPLVLLPVRITPRKNIEMALRVVKELARQYPECALLVTGPPGAHNAANADYFDRLLALRKQLGMQQTVFFAAELRRGPLSDRVVADLYRVADLLLLPSVEEGFGLPLLEAGLAGLPVFCSEIESLRELGGPDATYFAPDASPSTVSNVIAAALRSSTRFAFRLRILHEYAWQRIYSDRLAPLLRGE